MTITELVELGKRNQWYWADTEMHARIRGDIGDPVLLNLVAPNVDPAWKDDPIGFAKLHAPYRSGLPKKTEVSFYVIDNSSTSNTPSITVQYVVAKR